MKPGPFQLLPARRSSGWAKQLIEYLVTARIKLIVDPGSPGIICRALVVVFASGLRGCAGLQVGSGAARDGMPRTSLKPRSGDCSQRMRAHAGRHRSPRARERGLAGKQEHRRGADARVMVRASTRPWLSGLLISRATLAQVQRSEGAGSRVRDVVLPRSSLARSAPGGSRCTDSLLDSGWAPNGFLDRFAPAAVNSHADFDCLLIVQAIYRDRHRHSRRGPDIPLRCRTVHDKALYFHLYLFALRRHSFHDDAQGLTRHWHACQPGNARGAEDGDLIWCCLNICVRDYAYGRIGIRNFWGCLHADVLALVCSLARSLEATYLHSDPVFTAWREQIHPPNPYLSSRGNDTCSTVAVSRPGVVASRTVTWRAWFAVTWGHLLPAVVVRWLPRPAAGCCSGATGRGLGGGVASGTSAGRRRGGRG